MCVLPNEAVRILYETSFTDLNIASVAFFRPGSATSSHSSIVGWAASTCVAKSAMCKLLPLALRVAIDTEGIWKAETCTAMMRPAAIVRKFIIVNRFHCNGSKDSVGYKEVWVLVV